MSHRGRSSFPLPPADRVEFSSKDNHTSPAIILGDPVPFMTEAAELFHRSAHGPIKKGVNGVPPPSAPSPLCSLRRRGLCSECVLCKRVSGSAGGLDMFAHDSGASLRRFGSAFEAALIPHIRHSVSKRGLLKLCGRLGHLLVGTWLPWHAVRGSRCVGKYASLGL